MSALLRSMRLGVQSRSGMARMLPLLLLFRRASRRHAFAVALGVGLGVGVEPSVLVALVVWLVEVRVEVAAADGCRGAAV